MKKYTFNKSVYMVERLNVEIFLFNAGESMMYSFKNSGLIIIQGLRKGLGKKDIIKNLVSLYHISKEMAVRDFDSFVQKLIKIKILYEA